MHHPYDASSFCSPCLKVLKLIAVFVERTVGALLRILCR